MLSLNPSKYWCRAFFLAIAVVFALFVALFAALGLGELAVVAVVVTLAAVVLAARADRSTLSRALYRAFAAATGSVARAVRGLAQVACFIVVTAAGRGGGLDVERPARRSMWQPKHSLDPDAYSMPYVGQGRRRSNRWARGYVSWARHSGNTWTLALLPFLLLQRTGQHQDDLEVRGEIYTLY